MASRGGRAARGRSDPVEAWTVRPLPSGRLEQDARDALGEPAPLLRLDRQPLAPGLGETVELDLALGVREPPFGFDPPLPLQPVERGIERALFYPERVGAAGLDPLRDGVAMARPPGEGFQ